MPVAEGTTRTTSSGWGKTRLVVRSLAQRAGRVEEQGRVEGPEVGDHAGQEAAAPGGEVPGLAAHLGQGQAGWEGGVQARGEAGEGQGPGQQVGLLVIHHSISL